MLNQIKIFTLKPNSKSVKNRKLVKKYLGMPEEAQNDKCLPPQSQINQNNNMGEVETANIDVNKKKIFNSTSQSLSEIVKKDDEFEESKKLKTGKKPKLKFLEDVRNLLKKELSKKFAKRLELSNEIVVDLKNNNLT